MRYPNHRNFRFKIKPVEIKPGLALFMSPEVLLEEGAYCSVPRESMAVIGNHVFLCLHAYEDGSRSAWTPLLSRPSDLRITLPNEGRSGDPRWVDALHSFYPNQLWTMEPVQLVKAARAAGDASTHKHRNLISSKVLATVNPLTS